MRQTHWLILWCRCWSIKCTLSSRWLCQAKRKSIPYLKRKSHKPISIYPSEIKRWLSASTNIECTLSYRTPSHWWRGKLPLTWDASTHRYHYFTPIDKPSFEYHWNIKKKCDLCSKGHRYLGTSLWEKNLLHYKILPSQIMSPIWTLTGIYKRNPQLHGLILNHILRLKSGGQEYLIPLVYIIVVQHFNLGKYQRFLDN